MNRSKSKMRPGGNAISNRKLSIQAEAVRVLVQHVDPLKEVKGGGTSIENCSGTRCDRTPT